jgi:UDP-N-acetylglucosamine 2-epimerase (non-hydrolysing)
MANLRRVLIVFGTRPEAIKMAPVVHAFKARSELFETQVCVTAQHREMLDQVLQLFAITPDFDLDLMRARQTLHELTARVIIGVGEVIEKCKPDILLIHGDTTTTMAAAIAAFYARVPVGHVEAGLRTGDIHAPWPEEFNRRVASVVTRWHFAPTAMAANNLLKEGCEPRTVFVTGNTVVDALFDSTRRIAANLELSSHLSACFPFLDASKKLLLVTGHRRENWGDPFIRICDALVQLAKRDDVQIVYPVHLNPAIREPAHQRLGGVPNVHLIEPQDYLPFVYLMQRAYLVITDSGGIQEEAPSLGKPVLVVREVTERPEAVAAGTVKLVGTDTQKIVSCAVQLLQDGAAYRVMSEASNPFGDGTAATQIVEALKNS